MFSGPDLVDYTRPLAVVEGVTEATVPNAIAVGEVKRFAVLAIDAADNRDANTIALRHELSAPPTSPTFAGCRAMTARGSKAVTVEWAAATDDATPASAIAYDVWLATSPGGEVLGGAPTATTVGTTSIVIGSLTPNTTYYAICRARDGLDDRDGNSIEKSAKTSDDATVPTFAGIDTITFDATLRTVQLTWPAATDDRTAADKIVYQVYERRGLDQYDFAKPRITTAANVLSVDIADLPSDTALAWVVRARDEALNEDANLQEKGGTTYVSFALDIQPIYTKNCAVVGCHVSALPAGGLSLNAAFAYAQTVSVTAGQRPSDYGTDAGVTPPNIKRIEPFTPDESYLLRKTQVVNKPFTLSQMPAPGTGNTLSDADKKRLKSWVEQGAPKN